MTTTQNKQSKKNSAMKKIGQGLKETFMEMSESLAGWIDDTGDQFTKKKRQNCQGSQKTGCAKGNTQSQNQSRTTVEKPKPEPGLER